jgi:hypothetical protein
MSSILSQVWQVGNPVLPFSARYFHCAVYRMVAVTPCLGCGIQCGYDMVFFSLYHIRKTLCHAETGKDDMTNKPPNQVGESIGK